MDSVQNDSSQTPGEQLMMESLRLSLIGKTFLIFLAENAIVLNLYIHKIATIQFSYRRFILTSSISLVYSIKIVFFQ
jgi:HKD family nuclease